MDESDAPQNRSNDDAELSKSSDENVSSCREKKCNPIIVKMFVVHHIEMSFGLCDF